MGEKSGQSKRGRKKGSAARKAPGRTEVISIRISPRTRHLAEIAARAQLRTLSGYIEWAINESFRSVTVGERGAIPALGEREGMLYPLKLSDKADALWYSDAADRLVALAILFPGLLDDHELMLWRLIQESDAAWRHQAIEAGSAWRFERTGPDLPTLRRFWSRFEQAAVGKAGEDILPRRVFHDGVDGGRPTSEVIDPLVPSDEEDAG